MGFRERFWGKLRITMLEVKDLYLPNTAGVMTKITATADEINALSPAAAPPDSSVTNAKMASDVKIGSLASLATTVKTSIQAAINEIVSNIGALSGLSTTAKNTIVEAINEVDGHADAAYVKPGGGIPSGDMTAAVQASLGKADTALQASIGRVVAGVIQLTGWAVTKVVFGDATSAYITGIAAPVDMSTPGNGGTIKLTIDGGAEQTATLNCAAGNHTGGTSCATDMTASVDTKLKIRANGDETWHTITLDWVGGSCDSGAEIAAEIQTKVRALGASYGYDAISVAFNTNKLIFTSAMLGTNSTIEIERAADHDCCDELDIGPDNGVTTVGTGDCADVTAVTPQEIADLINGDTTGCVASLDGSTLKITSEASGRTSRVLAGNGTLNTLCGIPNNEVGYGAQSLGEEDDWADANYQVLLTYKGTGAAGKDLGWDTPAVGGFNVTCETTGDVGYVSVLVVG
jgi:hypothetical protein